MFSNLTGWRRPTSIVAALLFTLAGIASCTPGALSSEMGKTPDIPDQEKCDPKASTTS